MNRAASSSGLVRTPWAAMLVLGLLVLLLHVHTLHAWFVGDDYDILRIVTEKQGWGDALRMTYAGNWGPVSYLQFYFNYRTGGFDPLPYHLTNLFWLWLTVVALYVFVRTVWPEARFAAWAAALLFTSHPLHDEAVSYICARSHVTAAALATVSLLLYARFRRSSGSGLERAALLTGAVLTAFVGGLSKESALTVPLWIFAFEWLFVRDDGGLLIRRAVRALRRSAPFFAAAAAVPLARWLAVGGAQPRLEEATVEAVSLLHRITTDLSVYGLYGALPIPFGWMSLAALGPWRVLGWIVVATAYAVGLCCLGVSAAGGPFGRAAGVYVLGLVIASVTLLPVVVAGLPLRRRYLFIASLGIALMAAAAFERLRAARPRVAHVALGVTVLLFGAGLAQRNDLYRRSGQVAQSFFLAVLTAPDAEDLYKIALITIPRFYAGDNVSGAYLLHRTDIEHGLKLFGVESAQVAYPLKCDFADDYSSEASFVSAHELDLVVRFRSQRAYEAAHARDPALDAWRNNARALLVSADPAGRELRYRVTLKDDFWDTESRALFLYSDGKFTRLRR